MRQQRLHQGWTCEALGPDALIPDDLRGRAFYASVPGCVYEDLRSAWLIPDPLRDQHERELLWVAQLDWRYRAPLAPAPGLLTEEVVELVFEGLDTLARVSLDEGLVGESRNMFVPARWEVTGRLGRGPHELCVELGSPLRHAQAQEALLGEHPHVERWPYPMLRKAAYQFGWDWGPSLPAGGIWGPVSLVGWSVARLSGAARVWVLEAQEARASVRVCVEILGSPQGGAGLTLTVALGEPDTGRRWEVTRGVEPGLVAVDLEVDAPKLWWPRALGGSPLYGLSVRLEAQGKALDQRSARVGLRVVALDTEGGAFALSVNGRGLFCKGANWVPDDVYPHRARGEKVRRRLAQAALAGVEVLRVWGGGLYESEDFYDTCDELGLLVWQDFAFACAAYPEDPQTRASVEAEARHHVARLCSHPSLALWCGGNECVWGWHDWGWRERLGGRPWGLGYYAELLPRVVAELDPTRPYVPNTPWSGEAGLHPNDDARGPSHLWRPWNEFDDDAYEQHRPRFVAEFGFQGAATWATWRGALRALPSSPDDEAVQHRQRAWEGARKLRARLAARLPTLEGWDQWLYATQWLQAQAVERALVWLRVQRPRCAGALVWQWNDCWPGLSWSAVDAGERPKLAWYAVRRGFLARRLALAPGLEGEGLCLYALNDTDHAWELSAQVVRVDREGEVLAQARVGLRAEAQGVARAALPPALVEPGEARRELLWAQAPGAPRVMKYFVEDKDFDWPAARFEVSVSSSALSQEVRVEARGLLRGFALDVSRLDPGASAEDAGVDLLPGEVWSCVVHAPSVLGAEALAGVARCVNALGRGVGG